MPTIQVSRHVIKQKKCAIIIADLMLFLQFCIEESFFDFALINLLIYPNFQSADYGKALLICFL